MGGLYLEWIPIQKLDRTVYIILCYYMIFYVNEIQTCRVSVNTKKLGNFYSPN